ncbi:cortical cell-delineating protein-like [Panicum miliaceum]|uniref:Cortical cell-delineating protein-like n=1 Tax=Panicum miliaceum TaxID=4540 RepID=A0A3L6THU5_PANMI|nr:cortical cell-delineating protein-like [Panicum miliaceum]RLN39206.1 cortical cell-delineating protein-like [Panicum miliaceum]
MAAKLGLFVALNLIVFAAGYVQEPPTPTTPKTDAHGQWPAGLCPVDALKLDVCASLLGGLIKISLPEDRESCCQLLDGLADINAAACLCTVLKANILGIPLRVPIDISLGLNQCGRTNSPRGFTCPGH